MCVYVCVCVCVCFIKHTEHFIHRYSKVFRTGVAREGQGYPCCQHDMMMMMMIAKYINHYYHDYY